MIDKLITFLSMSEPNVRYVVLGSLLMASSSAVVGCFAFLRKRALVGDAVAHSVLPGICLAFILSGTKNPLVLLIGAMATGWLSLILMDVITRKTRIKEDTAIGLILSVFFGVGILLLTAIQGSGNPEQAGLNNFLFGKAAAMVREDVIIFGIVAVLLILFVLVFFKEFKLISFDKDYARAIGYPVNRIEFMLTTLTVLAVVVGIQAVGVVLMAAMLITPAAAARYWTQDLRVMVVLAAIFGAFSGLSGSFISYLEPAMPTGPWIVVVVSFIAFASLLFSPGRGMLARVIRQWQIRRKMADENILKMFFHLGEKDDAFQSDRSLDELLTKRNFALSDLKQGLSRLHRHGFLAKAGTGWRLTRQGLKKGRRVTRLHRLWELYLTQYLRIAPDHVHEDAETIEHIITPELENELEKLLEFPEIDPHSSQIPPKNE